MPIDVFMWIAGILLGIIGALLALMWSTLSRSLDKMSDTLTRLEEKLTTERLERSKMSSDLKDKMREEQATFVTSSDREQARLESKLDDLREDLNDCRETLSGVEAGLVQRSELRGIMVDCINAAKGIK